MIYLRKPRLCSLNINALASFVQSEYLFLRKTGFCMVYYHIVLIGLLMIMKVIIPVFLLLFSSVSSCESLAAVLTSDRETLTSELMRHFKVPIIDWQNAIKKSVLIPDLYLIDLLISLQMKCNNLLLRQITTAPALFHLSVTRVMWNGKKKLSRKKLVIPNGLDLQIKSWRYFGELF